MQLTLGEFRAATEHLPDDMVIHIAYDFGDRVHKTVTPEVASYGCGIVKHSSYYNSDVLKEDGDKPKIEAGEKEVFVLSALRNSELYDEPIGEYEKG